MRQRAYYSASLTDFLGSAEESILGTIAANNEHELELTQRNAWQAQIKILKDQLRKLDDGHLFFEFSIPRMGKRADVVYLTRRAVYVLEFKVGASEHLAADIAQVVDYAVDLKNFHEGSHGADIVPILIATNSPSTASSIIQFGGDRVASWYLSILAAGFVERAAWRCGIDRGGRPHRYAARSTKPAARMDRYHSDCFVPREVRYPVPGRVTV